MKGKHIAGLDCSAPAEEMIRHVLRSQLAAMVALRSQALDWKDPEGVHDMRVLSRRLRSAISDFEPYLKKTRLPLTRLRAIARKLGSVRDEDVGLAALEKLKPEMDGRSGHGLEIIIAAKEQHREVARADLKKALKRSAIAELVALFESRLGQPAPVTALQPLHTGPTFRAIGARVVNARLKELYAGGSHIYFPADVKGLHELRISAKGLRYAVELFAACWGDDMRGIAKEIAQLQTSLGELHDCDVWMAELGTRLKRGSRQVRTEPENLRTSAACTYLLSHFAKVRTEHYRDALGRWQKWQADGFLHSLKSLVGP